MRNNKWNDGEASKWITEAGDNPADRLLAERVYSSRIIGADPDLVMHGGGNTSVKVKRKDLFGNDIDVLHVKGSGWDLDTLQAPGLPGVKMEPLMALRNLDALSDEDMVNVQRANLIDTTSPNPSVETLLHAYLPHRFVDHTHATAFLVLANLSDAEAIIKELFDGRLVTVPYIMPGFALAKKAAEVFDANPDCDGLVLLKHGHFTFGANAKESYDRVIEHTNIVEEYLAERANGRTFSNSVFVNRTPISQDKAREVLPILRGQIAQLRNSKQPIMDLRAGTVIEAFLARTDLEALSTRGVGSPDHVIRTKGAMLHLSKADLEGGVAAIQDKVNAYAQLYRARFETQNKRVGGIKTMLDPNPCVAWIEGVGVVGLGKDAAAAAAAADIAEQTVEVMTLAQTVGSFEPIGEDDLFDMEYWSLEQAKLKKATDKPLTGQIVAITGGAGAIGFATAKAFSALGAAIALIDLNGEACAKAAEKLGANCFAVTANLSEEGAASAALNAVVERFGGLDILVSNAGYALQGNILELEESALRGSFEVNFFAHLAMAKAAARIFEQQGFGGQMLFNVSKQAVNPGKGFGAYGLPKAATFFLVRQLALELGEKNIRVNGVNADRIRSGVLTDDFIKTRAGARGVSTTDYMAGNLLKKEVEAHHVADVFIALALSERTTAHVMTVDGGNIEATLR